MSKTAPAAAPASTAVAAPASTAVGEVFDYGADAGVGFEGTTAKDLAIPFIGILQSNSPQIDGDSPVEGAKAGMLFNTVTGELTAGDKGVAFIPVYYEKAFVEWKPRTAGGGFVASHDPDSELVKAELAKQEQRGKIILANKNELIETEYCYVLLLDNDFESVNGFAVFSMTSTKLTPFRKFKTSLWSLKKQPPLFVNRAVLTTTKQSNEKGTFYNAKFSPIKGGNYLASLIPPGNPLVKEAKDFRELVISGMAKAAFETQNATGDTGNGNKEDAPF